MPFKSESQRKYMWKKHPEIARKWTEKYGSEPMKRKKRDNGFFGHTKCQKLF